ncbi:MAG: TRAP transporter small permease subunit [Reinekea sp.]
MDIVSVLAQPISSRYKHANWLVRTLAHSVVVFAFVYLVNNYLNVWRDWPGVVGYFFSDNTASGSTVLAWLQLASYVLIVPLVLARMFTTPERRMIEDSDRLSAHSAYIIRVAFWSIVLIGLMDGLISWMRVEDLLTTVFGDNIGTNLGKSSFRGTWVHYPVIIVSLFVGYRYKTISVSWLALLVVFAEAWIVTARFVFSYEQTLMGDLVRFWYAGLFLFASAYTLKEDGHVRVDVIYSGRGVRYKCWVNIIGTILLAYPLVWIILTMGLWEKNSLLNSPLLSFEISQSSYGLFIKYLMAAYLVVFAVSMLVQFSSMLLKHAAILTDEVTVKDDHHDEALG